jgi:hypothetical protein
MKHGDDFPHFSFFAVHCKVVHFLKEKSKKPFKKQKQMKCYPFACDSPEFFSALAVIEVIKHEDNVSTMRQ